MKEFMKALNAIAEEKKIAKNELFMSFSPQQR